MDLSNRWANKTGTAVRPAHVRTCLKLGALEVLLVASLAAPCAFAQLPDVTRPTTNAPSDVQLTMFPHPPESRLWLSGQANFIYQTNPPFDAEYSGPNSFRSDYDKANGRVMTLFTGYQLTKSIEVLVDFEEAAGLGLSGVLGIAGFTNLDAVRDATLSEAPYLARVVYHQVFAFSHETVDGNRGPLSTFARLPSRRLELRAGKFAITDYFDTNTYGSDSHLQFLNWAVDQNGAYDFTADARGYTWGFTPSIRVRRGERDSPKCCYRALKTAARLSGTCARPTPLMANSNCIEDRSTKRTESSACSPM
jgi:high affinity Mn2+ porin